MNELSTMKDILSINLENTEHHDGHWWFSIIYILYTVNSENIALV